MIEVNFGDDIMEYPLPSVSLDRPTAQMMGKKADISNYMNVMSPMLYDTMHLIDETYNDDLRKHGYIPYACTFTYPDDTTCNALIKNSKSRMIAKYVLLEDASQKEQRDKMVRDITKWINAVNKLLPKSTPIETTNIYFELTKKGRIHGHGIVYIANNYTIGVREMMALQWARISKGSMSSMHKTNATGGRDHAFDKCNNVSKWLAYISKEFKPE